LLLPGGRSAGKAGPVHIDAPRAGQPRRALDDGGAAGQHALFATFLATPRRTRVISAQLITYLLDGVRLLPPWPGGLVFAAWVTVIASAGTVITARRDITDAPHSMTTRSWPRAAVSAFSTSCRVPASAKMKPR
jgi:hypothetical protein